MSHFTEQELAYLSGQRLGRLAAVNARGEPHLTAVGFLYNPTLDTIDIGGRRGGFGASKKFRDAQANSNVAFIVDDVVTEDEGGQPRWQPRGIEIRGRAEVHATGGEQLGAGYDPAFIRIFPTRIISWGINAEGYQPNSRRIG
jgi:pyridoxamine 5'-phosphate oxidase family protein